MAEKSVNDLVTAIPKADGSELRVEIAHYRGREFLALRMFERQESGGPLRPSPSKGLTVPLREMGPCLLDAITAALAGRVKVRAQVQASLTFQEPAAKRN